MARVTLNFGCAQNVDYAFRVLWKCFSLKCDSMWLCWAFDCNRILLLLSSLSCFCCRYYHQNDEDSFIILNSMRMHLIRFHFKSPFHSKLIIIIHRIKNVIILDVQSNITNNCVFNALRKVCLKLTKINIIHIDSPSNSLIYDIFFPFHLDLSVWENRFNNNIFFKVFHVW